MANIDFLNKKKPSAHGGGVRGDSTVSRSELFQGRFGRIFRSLPAAHWSQKSLQDLAEAMTAEAEHDDGEPRLPAAPTEEGDRIQDDEENAGIAAGYTYFAQFVDHDLTFDPASSLQKQNDPDALIDYRTPRLDLDALYGRGPEDQPYMYDGHRLRLGAPLFFGNQPSRARDLPRYVPAESDVDQKKRALIGDKRNDENVIVSQLHSAFMQFHNKLVDLRQGESFEAVQREVRWTYQWLVVNDFLRTICGDAMVNSIIDGAEHNKPRFKVYKWRNDAFMPVEFSAAAYRFGHSMVRPVYRLNQELDGGAGDTATGEERKRGLGGRFFIFAGVQKRGLNGFDAPPREWAIDWSLFFDIDGSRNNGGKARVQPAYKIDTSLVNPLGFLPEFSKDPVPGTLPLTIDQLQSKPVDRVNNPANLVERNLLRGLSMGLPSGQAVAKALGETPIADAELLVGKATLDESVDQKKTLVSISPSFAGNAPLWFYVLAEAQHAWVKAATGKSADEAKRIPVRLGPVGGRIVAETLIGLLWADGQSYLRQDWHWRPNDDISTVGQLINFAVPKK